MRIPRMYGKRILVEPFDKRRSRGGIELPQCVRGESALEGRIVAVGPECEYATTGKDVCFPPYAKYVVPAIEGKYKNHLVVNEEDILMFWEGEEDDPTESTD